MTRKKKVKEADVTVSIKPDRSGVNLDYKKAVKELEPVNDEEPTTVKQSYVAPETIVSKIRHFNNSVEVFPEPVLMVFNCHVIDSLN